MLHFIREYIRKNNFFRKLVGYHLASSGLFDNYFRNYILSDAIKKRLSNILSSPDNEYIPRCDRAGDIIRGKQIMHNGLKIHLGSYYGPEYSVVLRASKGVHEPQEERVFREVLPAIPPKAVMIEMGSFWSFYSMWFQKEIPGAVNFMIEPDEFNMGQGKRNFKLNGMKGEFIQAFIGESSGQLDHGKCICIDDFVEERKLPFVHMLHSDIQGFEYDMLLGAKKTIQNQKLGYIFISTHSNELHEKCLKFLEKNNFTILASANLDESYSEDGLIAARHNSFAGIGSVSISKRKLREN